jgi:hypothetical protein
MYPELVKVTVALPLRGNAKLERLSIGDMNTPAKAKRN